MKPMLAATATVAEIEALLKSTPLFVTPKLDGIRCLVHGNKLLSRSLKSIPNKFINTQLVEPWLEGLDGELMVDGSFQNVTSAVMNRSGEPDFTYWVFDYHDRTASPYTDRIAHMAKHLRVHPRVRLVPHWAVDSIEELNSIEEQALDKGFEGLILRHPDRGYKYGRSTVREAGMLKLKRFEDREAVVVGYEAEMENTNAAMTNELGRTKRSSAKAGMKAKDTLGNLLLHDVEKGWKFSVGSGFDDAEAARLWAMGDKLIGQLCTYKYFPVGCKDAPRFPVYKGIRDPRDMS